MRRFAPRSRCPARVHCRPSRRQRTADRLDACGSPDGTRSAESRVRKRLLLVPLLLTTLGCHGLRPTLPALPQRDGDGDAVRLHRLDQAAARLGVTGIEVALSPRAEPGAWAWPKGPIQVSRTLVDLVDDDELA